MENKAISSSKVDFEQLFKALPGLFLVLSPDLRVLEASEQYLQATHSGNKDLKAMYLLDAFPENPNLKDQKPREAIEASLQQVLQFKEPHTIPRLRYDILNKAGVYEERYWMLKSIPMLSDTNDVQYILHEVQDITEKTTKEHEIQASQENLTWLTHNMGGTVWEADLTTSTITWSEAYTELFGYGEEELETELQRWSSYIHPEDREPIISKFQKLVAAKEKSFNLEYRYQHADGSYANVFSYGYIFYDQHAAPVKLVGSVLDLRKQKESEHKLKEANERFQRIAMATSDVIWDWNLTDDSIWWNEGFKFFFGYTAEDIEPTVDSWTSRVHPEDQARVVAKIHEAIDGGASQWEDEYRFRCAPGNYAVILDKGFIIRDQTGTAIRMVGAMVDITEKKRVQQELADTMNRLQQVMDSLPLMSWIAKPDGAVTYYNQRWYDYTGYSYESLKEWGWSKIIHPDDEAQTRQLWLEALATGKVFVAENRWRSKENNVYRWFLARGVPVRDNEGNITMWVGSHTDIQESKQTMLALEESKQKFEFLTEAIPQIVWSARPNGEVDYFNDRWYQYTGMNEESSLKFGWKPALHPEDGDATLRKWLKSMQTGQDYDTEFRLLDFQTNAYRWFVARALPMRNAAGEITKWFGTCTDIHDQKQLHERLVASEEQFRFLAESIAQMVWTTDPDGYHTYFNQRWLDYTGLSLEESLGMEWKDVLHPDDRERSSDRWQYSLRTGDYYEIEYRFKNGRDGTYRWFLGQAMPMRNSEGQIVKWFGTCTDIEDHKRAEEELVERNLELKRINQDLDSFVYTASHDLKLPIINMAGIFEELTRSAEFRDPDAPRMVEMFNKSLQQIHTTIHDLSEVVKVQKTQERDHEQIDLQDLTEDVKVSIQDLLQDTGAIIKTDFGDAPSIAFSRANLKSIFYNLLSNALKYRAHERVPEISLTTTRKGDFIELQVQDNGIGIDMNKHQSKLFQLFKRFHNHVNGSGLGLYIVNRLLTNNGGYINIESKLNKGTTFYLYFKLKKAY